MRAILTLSSKGQLVVPATMRAAMGLKAGDRLEALMESDGKTITLRRFPTREEVDEIARTVVEHAGVPPLMDVDAYYQAHREPRL